MDVCEKGGEAGAPQTGAPSILNPRDRTEGRDTSQIDQKGEQGIQAEEKEQEPLLSCI